MGLRPTQGDEKASVRQPLSTEPLPFPLSSRAKPRDLQFSGPFVEMFFDQSCIGLWLTQGDEKRLGTATTLYVTALSLSSRPKRIRISYTQNSQRLRMHLSVEKGA
jgi:hypothetical protein